MRVFLDTNVLVSAFAARGLCAELFELVLLEHELILGRSVLRELGRVLRRKVKLPADAATAAVAYLTDVATQIADAPDPVTAALDHDDVIVLGDAVAGRAEVFVTGDAKILALGRYGRIRIVSPRAFWELLRAAKSR